MNLPRILHGDSRPVGRQNVDDQVRAQIPNTRSRRHGSLEFGPVVVPIVVRREPTGVEDHVPVDAVRHRAANIGDEVPESYGVPERTISHHSMRCLVRLDGVLLQRKRCQRHRVPNASRDQQQFVGTVDAQRHALV